MLAGIGKVESDHGQSDAPGVHSGANFAGAEGPMQFEPATFAEYAVDADHTGKPRHLRPGRRDLHRRGDALRQRRRVRHARRDPAGHLRLQPLPAYVTDVLTWAARYTTPAAFPAAAIAVAFAMRQVGKPYQWGATGPDAYDCSGLVYAAYAAAGIRIARTTFGWRQDGPQIPLPRDPAR